MWRRGRWWMLDLTAIVTLGATPLSLSIRGVNIALGSASPSSCAAFDRDGNGVVAINELVGAVNAALLGCPAASG